MLVDSHCHFHLMNYPELDYTMDQAYQLAVSRGVEAFLCVATHPNQTEALEKMAAAYDNIYISFGLHPNEPPSEHCQAEQMIQQAKANPKVVAIGETGLDYYRSPEDSQWQLARFEEQIEIAKAVNKPLIIHTRQAKQHTIEVMKKCGADKVGGVMHCFTEDLEMAEQAMALGFYISFSGIVSFKNATNLQYVAKKVPLDRILVETDCPYLAPTPYRGQPNQPAYVVEVAKAVAELREMSLEALAQATTENFNRLFLAA